MTGGRIGPGSRSLMLSRPRVRIHFCATCSPASSTRVRSGPRRGIGPVSLMAGKPPVLDRIGWPPVRDEDLACRSPNSWDGDGTVGAVATLGSVLASTATEFLVTYGRRKAPS